MHFGRAVIDAEGAHFAEHLLDDGLVGHASSAHHLHAAIGHAHQSFGHGDFGHAALGHAEAAGIEHAGAPVDHQFGLLQVDHVFRQHEADALVVDQRLAKSHAAVGVVGGDFVCASTGTEPPHAVREPRRAEPDLRIFEPFAGIAEHLVSRNAQVFNADLAVSAGHRTIDGVGDMGDADCGVGQVDEEHARAALAVVLFRAGHDDADVGPVCAGGKAFAPVHYPVIAIAATRGDHHRRV